MEKSKYDTLVTGLVTATKSGRITWQPTINEDVFMVSFPGYSVQILTFEDWNENTFESFTSYILKLLNDEGHLIEQIRPDDLANNGFSVLQTIYTIARRQAIGAEKAVDTIIESLSKLNDTIDDPFAD